MQPYAFTGDDPLNATDPLGLKGGGGNLAALECRGLKGHRLSSCDAKYHKTQCHCSGKGPSLLNFAKKHWRGIAKVGVVVAGVAGGALCAGSVVCGVIAGGIASAAYYSAGHAGTSSFSATGLVESTAIGGALGAGSSAAQDLLSSGVSDLNSVLDAGFVSAASQPLATIGTVAQGYAKLGVGGGGFLLFNTGSAASYLTDRSGG
jgi:hypothetical protein